MYVRITVSLFDYSRTPCQSIGKFNGYPLSLLIFDRFEELMQGSTVFIDTLPHAPSSNPVIQMIGSLPSGRYRAGVIREDGP